MSPWILVVDGWGVAFPVKQAALMSISRSIVPAHGRRIWASANVDRGLTVHVELWCEEPA